MLVIAGLSVLLGAAVVHAASSTRAAHPPTENMRVRLLSFKLDRRDVPLSDHGRRGGAARTSLPLGPRPLHRGVNARNAAALAFANQARDGRLEHQERADTAVDLP